MKLKMIIFLNYVVFSGIIRAADSITVYIFLLDECPICQEATAELNSLYNKHNKRFGFLGVFPNFVSKPKQIENFKSKYKVKFPTKTDYSKSLVNKFEATVLPEVVVYNEAKKKILYRGSIDDRYLAPNKRKYAVSYQYLREALEAIISNQKIAISSTKPIGCIIETKKTF